MKAMLGMNSGTGTTHYKLNKITMSGDDGSFKLVDLLSERDKGVKPASEDLGKSLDGVILKMRWQLSRYEESGSLNSSEYDDKWKDTVTVYPSKDKGSVETMKAKYKLSTQRVIYFYVPSKQAIVRLIVKASAFSDDESKNTDGKLSLFGYMNYFADDETLPCQYVTTCSGSEREGKNPDGSRNKRKDHVAMSFTRGRILTDSEFEKVQKMMIEVNEKTNTVSKDEDVQETVPSTNTDDNWDVVLNSDTEDVASAIPF